MAVFPVVIDACVLFNAPVRDTLLRAAEYDLYRVHWSRQILEEVERNLVAEQRTTAEQARSLIKQLDLAFPEALVEVPAKLIDAMPNNHKDRHVAAAAIVAQAQVITTFDIDGFKGLEEYSIEPQHPDAYLLYLLSLHPPTIERILQEQAQDIAWSLDSLLNNLSKHVPQFVKAFRVSQLEQFQ
jgi:predicted nucleic acid-binding protein